MKDKSNLHLKVQDLCDCFATTDPLKEMSVIRDDNSQEDAALKWLALAVLHGINDNAEKISLTQKKDGEVQVKAVYRKKTLPSPGKDLAGGIIDAVQSIAHFDHEKGKTDLALGIRDSSFGLALEMDTKKNKKKMVIKFPKQIQ